MFILSFFIVWLSEKIMEPEEMEGRELGDGCSVFHKHTEGKKRLIPKPVLLCSQQVLKLRVC